MAGISITVSADDLVTAGLDGLVARADDMSGAMDEIGGMMTTSTRHRFEMGVDPDGNPWPPSLRALAEGGQTLVDRGHLRAAVTYQATAARVRQGTNLVYARIHQLGGEIKRQARTQTIHRRLYADGRLGERFVKRTARGAVATDHAVGAHTITMPARPYLGLSTADRAQAGEILADWLTGAW
ncbi:phage virion morphogenesis protein [Roseospira visakhapatnamensis]|uniref:Phage virion morphogenesis protein n=1 Tax=Roseospira visakhapatnamensis TaxID=390880 RepID=A0A7W6WBS7_9PROT|nr:phage virion morphogenesis protein [Roseospira visakhapatnamensis]MBB4268143.1 phage virion morphogenesis protein [Roseospira visakhapatnamensis]